MQAVEKKHLKVCYKQLMLAKLGNEGKLDVLLVCVRPCVAAAQKKIKQSCMNGAVTENIIGLRLKSLTQRVSNV